MIRKRKRKIISLAICGLMTVSCIGCGNKDEQLTEMKGLKVPQSEVNDTAVTDDGNIGTPNSEGIDDIPQMVGDEAVTVTGDAPVNE